MANPPEHGDLDVPLRYISDRRRPEDLFEQNSIPQVLLDPTGTIARANREARRLLSLRSDDVSLSWGETQLSRWLGKLRKPVERAIGNRDAVTVHDVPWEDTNNRDSSTMDVVVSPVDTRGGVLITFVATTRMQTLRDELQTSQRELESAYEELQSAVEDLETTNEELHSTNEELETTNEELHSTNEELETTNEEVQSTNKELETMNNELRDRSSEVDDLNRFLQSILGSLQSAVVVLASDLDVLAWNHEAEEVWGRRADEVLGQHFLNLDIGLPVDKLRVPIREALAGRVKRKPVVLPAVNRLGRPVQCTVSVAPVAADDRNRGVMLMMDAAPADQVAWTGDGGRHAASPGLSRGKENPAVSDEA